ncbi:hypothetical protein [Janthinobacterium fluminis]|uniref:PEP-CTERM protein-sorting domain-containing protein n=1 Tax=Janthinobacterium fluminis TaxID=2987524 RepID=A0ABT5JXR4_9BURK|nr:hypothetical protein [Janthinobacterium fluminis]MDC8757429.1 hypothetical protein [Janthinobacterium fluminis]
MKFAILEATALLLAACAGPAAAVQIHQETPGVAAPAWHAAGDAVWDGAPAAPASVDAGAQRHGRAAASPVALPPGPMASVPETNAASMMLVGLGLLSLRIHRRRQEEKFKVE